ncbi:Gamma-glutamyl hydrolase 2, partial [Cymbomonas tetramitiformis]
MRTTLDQALPHDNPSSYIAASYIKFVEAGGARAVPILYDDSNENITNIFKSVNGLLFPGGGADGCTGRYFEVVSMLFDLAIEANNDGDYFPIHATCLGFEQLAVKVSGNCSILTNFSAEDAASPLLLLPGADKSALLGGDDTDMKWLRKRVAATPPLAMENHNFG